MWDVFNNASFLSQSIYSKETADYWICFRIIVGLFCPRRQPPDAVDKLTHNRNSSLKALLLPEVQKCRTASKHRPSRSFKLSRQPEIITEEPGISRSGMIKRKSQSFKAGILTFRSSVMPCVSL